MTLRRSPPDPPSVPVPALPGLSVKGDGCRRRVYLTVSVDTEEDNWYPTRDCITVENVRELPRFHAFLRRLGLRPTYFVGYPVATTRWTAGILRSLQDEGGAEIGAHLHPWNTPPLEEKLVPRNTMLKNLPFGLQYAKIETLRDAIGDAVGVTPSCFRAGRMGFGPETAAALIRAGFDVDSSVTPFVNWEGDDGANFVGAPVTCYRLGGGGDIRVPVPDGPLCEVPISCGFTTRPFGWWSRAFGFLTRPMLRPLKLAGIASTLGLARRVIGSPETSSVEDLLVLSRCLFDEGVTFLHLFLHSPSLLPGLSPFVSTLAERDRLYAMIESYVQGLAKMAPIRAVTVNEAARALSPLPDAGCR